MKEAEPRAPDPTYLNESEVARRTSLSASWLRQRRHKGGGPPFLRVAGRVVYKWVDVEQWMDTVGAGGPATEGELGGDP